MIKYFYLTYKPTPFYDEFDMEQPEIVPDGPGQFIVHGGAPVELVRQELNIQLEGENIHPEKFRFSMHAKGPVVDSDLIV